MMNEDRQQVNGIGGSGGSHSQSQNNWCGCPATVNNTNENHSFCAVCLGQYDTNGKVPIGLCCGHTVCKRCAYRLHPNFQGIPNVALLTYLEQPMIPIPALDPDCGAALFRLNDIAILLKNHASSRAIHRKVLNLICSLTFNGQNRICKAARAVGERTLVELSAACSHLSHYHAQQQLWGAIRARACQFMGPAMQEEALKLVLLALEDGSPLSRKVIVMFVVQRLAPQFPQASKTSIGHVIQLLYRASCFDVTKRCEASSLMTLRPEYRNYDSLRREHDAQIVKIALESGIRFSPEQWSSILYGDNNHKPHMQSIIDKLQAPQTFSQMTTEFLVSIQRLTDLEGSNFLLSIHPRFQLLSSIEVQPDSQLLPWSYVSQVLEAVHCVLASLFSFTTKSKAPVHNQYHAPTINHRNPSRHPPPPPMMLSNEVVPSPPHFVPCYPNVPSTSRRAIINGFPPPPLACVQQNQNNFQDASEIKELLAESRVLRARIKELQTKLPGSTVAQALEQEAVGLDEDVSRMVQRVNIH